MMYSATSKDGLRVVGTAETLKATAGVICFEKIGEHFEPAFTGTTEVDWDSQRTDKDPNGDLHVVLEDGTIVTLSSCIMTPEINHG